MSLSDDQRSDRSAGLTATDFAAILGLNPHRSPLDVWLEKTGKRPPFTGNERTKWGDLLEPVIRDDYATRRGVTVEQVGTQIQHTTPDAEVTGPTVAIAATPDGMVYVGDSCGSTGKLCTARSGLEIKTHSVYAADYGAEGTDEVPPHVALQCQIGMWVTGVIAWDVVAFWDGQPHDYHLTYDATTVDAALSYCLAWWRDHVVAHVQPTPDGSAASQRTVAGMFPGSWRGKTKQWLDPAEEAVVGSIDQLRKARAAMKLAEREFARHRQALQLVIGDSDGFEWPEGNRSGCLRLSWSRSKDREAIDYKAALVDYQNRLAIAFAAADRTLACVHPDDNDEIADLRRELAAGPDLARYTAIVPGSRRFVVPRVWSKDVPGSDDDEMIE